ncbi:MAG: 5-(carboxyamino)imidazole ribonucleotide mutase [Bdellovibrionaceae bacterium]|nr:5-(carboxyamino)imidazole ribonucleotide mutase [Pseudobdellovibrionaceae bacterium]
MGSESDLKIMQRAAEILKQFHYPYHIEIVSAHRTPLKMVEFAQKAHERFCCIIAGAGGAAHLPGMVASITVLPVIGVPINVTSMQGVDSLYSIVQMPKGVPVACVAVDGAENAALLALRWIGVTEKEIAERLKEYQEKLSQKVDEQNRRWAMGSFEGG